MSEPSKGQAKTSAKARRKTARFFYSPPACAQRFLRREIAGPDQREIRRANYHLKCFAGCDKGNATRHFPKGAPA